MSITERNISRRDFLKASAVIAGTTVLNRLFLPGHNINGPINAEAQEPKKLIGLRPTDPILELVEDPVTGIPQWQALTLRDLSPDELVAQGLKAVIQDNAENPKHTIYLPIVAKGEIGTEPVGTVAPLTPTPPNTPTSTATNTLTPEPTATNTPEVPQNIIELDVVGPEFPHMYHTGLRNVGRGTRPIGNGFEKLDDQDQLVVFSFDYQSTLQADISEEGWHGCIINSIHVPAKNPAASTLSFNYLYVNGKGELVLYAGDNKTIDANRQRTVLSNGNDTHSFKLQASYDPATRVLKVKNLLTNQYKTVTLRFPPHEGSKAQISDISTEDATLEKLYIKVQRSRKEREAHILAAPIELEFLDSYYNTSLTYPREFNGGRLRAEDVLAFGNYVNISSQNDTECDNRCNLTSYASNSFMPVGGSTPDENWYNSLLHDEAWFAGKHDKGVMLKLWWDWTGQWRQGTRFDLPSINDHQKYMRRIMRAPIQYVQPEKMFIALADIIDDAGSYMKPNNSHANKSQVAQATLAEVPEGANLGIVFNGSLLSSAIRGNLIASVEEMRSTYELPVSFIQFDAHQDISSIRLLAIAAKEKGIQLIPEHIDNDTDIEGLLDIAREFGNMPILDMQIPSPEELTDPTTPDRFTYVYDPQTEDTYMGYIITGRPLERIVNKIQKDQGKTTTP